MRSFDQFQSADRPEWELGSSPDEPAAKLHCSPQACQTDMASTSRRDLTCSGRSMSVARQWVAPEAIGCAAGLDVGGQLFELIVAHPLGVSVEAGDGCDLAVPRRQPPGTGIVRVEALPRIARPVVPCDSSAFIGLPEQDVIGVKLCELKLRDVASHHR